MRYETICRRWQPVPFFAVIPVWQKIEEVLRQRVNLGSVHIHFKDGDDPLFRPHQDVFQARKGVTDQFRDVHVYEIQGKDGELAALGWVLDHGYLGAIDTAASIKGCDCAAVTYKWVNRACSTNCLSSRGSIPGPSASFTSWDERILPNGRRDHFRAKCAFWQLGEPAASNRGRWSAGRCRQTRFAEMWCANSTLCWRRWLHKPLGNRAGERLARASARDLQRETIREFRRMEKVAAHPHSCEGRKGADGAGLKPLSSATRYAWMRGTNTSIESSESSRQEDGYSGLFVTLRVLGEQSDGQGLDRIEF